MKRILVLLITLAALATACSNNVFSLAVGDCFNDPETEEVSNVETSACTEPHDNEVYALFDMTNAVYPGQAETQQIAIDGCLDRFTGYVDRDYETSKYAISFLTPTTESWDQDDREIVCFLYDLDGAQLNVTARNSGL